MGNLYSACPQDRTMRFIAYLQWTISIKRMRETERERERQAGRQMEGQRETSRETNRYRQTNRETETHRERNEHWDRKTNKRWRENRDRRPTDRDTERGERTEIKNSLDVQLLRVSRHDGDFLLVHRQSTVAVLLRYLHSEDVGGIVLHEERVQIQNAYRAGHVQFTGTCPEATAGEVEIHVLCGLGDSDDVWDVRKDFFSASTEPSGVERKGNIILALRLQKPLRLIRDGEVAGSRILMSNTYSLHCYHHNDSIKVGSCMSHFSVSLNVWAKSQDSVINHNVWRERRAEADPTEVLLLTSLAPYH